MIKFLARSKETKTNNKAYEISTGFYSGAINNDIINDNDSDNGINGHCCHFVYLIIYLSNVNVQSELDFDNQILF